MICQACGLNNRLRLNAMALRSIVQNFGTEPKIYATEQLTPFADYLRREHPSAEFSEFISPNARPGSVNEHGIRHEDVTALSYPDASFDVLICLEVLEHVPNYQAAIAEFSRVLRPGGYLLLSVPTALGSDENIVRARVTPDGAIVHICTPEYHGDPLNPENGILCFYHFGWKLLSEIKIAGFRDAFNDMYWSLLLGNIGSGQVLTTAIR
jgi:SAM-dependent methyltransferase